MSESPLSVTASERAERSTPRTAVIVRHPGLRHVSEEDVLHAIGGLAGLERVPLSFEVDTARFAEEINNGSWGAAHGEIWRRASELRDLLQRTPNARPIYAGMP